jgi:hypothetical protein
MKEKKNLQYAIFFAKSVIQLIADLFDNRENIQNAIFFANCYTKYHPKSNSGWNRWI